MTQLSKVVTGIVLLCAGCSSMPQSKSATDVEQAKEQIRLVLNQIIDACEKKDLPRLDSYHLYGPKFTKFDTGSPGRLDANAAREGEHKGLTAANDLQMRALDLDIKVFGNTAVSTFILSYSFKAGEEHIQRDTRATLVFVQDQGAWKIAHEHLSTVKNAP